ncbi:hypothetical protein [Natronomonas sp. EA1]|uniref:hypothetical protein n=1 Tax=Natronomonas sp. EA1 TaxID=3421655 RepID=UPI003EBE4EBB
MSRERIVQVLAVVMLVTSLFAAASIGGYRTSLDGPEPAAAGAEVPQSTDSGTVPATTPAAGGSDTAATVEPVLVGYTDEPMTTRRDGETVTIPAGTPVYAYVGTGANATTGSTTTGSAGSTGSTGGSTGGSAAPEEETGAS